MDHLLSMEISAVPCGIDGIGLAKTRSLFSFERACLSRRMFGSLCAMGLQDTTSICDVTKGL